MMRTLGSMSILIGLIAGASPLAFAQQGIGKRYGARDPKTCASMKEPAKGPISAAQALQYFICDHEKESQQTLYLISDLKIEVAPKGRPFNMNTDGLNTSHIDPSQPVYEIRGSFTRYLCHFIGDVNGQPGKNCSAYPQPHATGTCFKDTFGDWYCGLNDVNTGVDQATHGVPPPR